MIGYVPTPEDCVAVVLKSITIVVPNVSPLIRPDAVAENVGSAAPYCLEALAMVTISVVAVLCATVTVICACAAGPKLVSPA